MPIITSLFANKVTIFSAQATIGPSTPLPIDGYKTLTVEIWGTAGTGTPSRTITFEVQGDGGTGAWYPLSGINISTNLAATSTTNLGEIWQFDISGLNNFRLNLTALVGTGANVNAVGRMLPI